MSDDTRSLIFRVTAILAAAAVLIMLTLAILKATSQDRTNHNNFNRECIAAGKQVLSGNCVATS